MFRKEKRLGEILVKNGVISPEQLNEALEEQRKTKEFLGHIVVKKYGVRERRLLEALSEQFGMGLVDLESRYIDWNLVNRVSAAVIFDYKGIPIAHDGTTMTIAISNPLDVEALKMIEEESRLLARGVRFVLASGDGIEDVIARYRRYLRGRITRQFE